MKFLFGSLSFSIKLALKMVGLLWGLFSKTFGFIFKGFRFGMKNAGFIMFAYLCKFIFKLLTRPIMIGVVLGSVATFILVDGDRRKKVMELAGL